MRQLFGILGCTVFVVLAADRTAAQQAASQSPQQVPPQTSGAPAAQPPSQTIIYGEPTAEETREQLRNILRQNPPTLWQVLRLDPTLLIDADYLAPYPALAAFVGAHPEIARNPHYYLGSPESPYLETRPSAARAMEGMFQAALFLTGFVTVVAFVAWVVRTAVDYRRWLRLSKVQTETHLKLVDRFTSNDDLLTYVQSPAGQRFLHGGPLPADAPRAIGAPYGRILWSVQVGTVIMLLGGGLLFISRRLAADPELIEASPFMFMLGVMALTFGIGFLLSAVVAYVVSRRLGLLDAGAASSHA
jgi:hypothetical protein